MTQAYYYSHLAAQLLASPDAGVPWHHMTSAQLGTRYAAMALAYVFAAWAGNVVRVGGAA